MDNLENYIRKHRDEFDSEVPRPVVWIKIKDSIAGRQAKIIPLTGWLWKAAAVFLLGATTFLLIDKWKPDSAELSDADLFNEEFHKTESYYLTHINEMQARLTEHTNNEVVNRDLRLALNELDSLYNGLKKEFDNGVSNEKIADALIENLRIRKRIINKQLMILEAINQESDENIEI